MSRIKNVENEVRGLYELKKTTQDDWADWLYSNHVFLVAEEAGKLAERFGAQKDLAAVAGMLRDVADSVMSRFDDGHEIESLRIAREILRKSGFSENEIEIVVDDAIKFHSCFKGANPQFLEGKIMATADAVVHIKTDFYEFAISEMEKEGRDVERIKKWALEKIERDFNDKILFEEIRKEVELDYEKLKLFLRNKFKQ